VVTGLWVVTRGQNLPNRGRGYLRADLSPGVRPLGRVGLACLGSVEGPQVWTAGPLSSLCVSLHSSLSEGPRQASAHRHRSHAGGDRDVVRVAKTILCVNGR
jgi:hypothetical protein